MTTGEIIQYLKLMEQAKKIEPTASVPLNTYIKHVGFLLAELDIAMEMNSKQSRDIRAHVENLMMV